MSLLNFDIHSNYSRKIETSAPSDQSALPKGPFYCDVKIIYNNYFQIFEVSVLFLFIFLHFYKICYFEYFAISKFYFLFISTLFIYYLLILCKKKKIVRFFGRGTYFQQTQRKKRQHRYLPKVKFSILSVKINANKSIGDGTFVESSLPLFFIIYQAR